MNYIFFSVMLSLVDSIKEFFSVMLSLVDSINELYVSLSCFLQ